MFRIQLFCLSIMALLVYSCAYTQWLVDSTPAAISVAEPYIHAEAGGQCTNIGVYAGYEVDWSDQPTHSGAVIVGGCGVAVKLVCGKAPGGGAHCDPLSLWRIDHENTLRLLKRL